MEANSPGLVNLSRREFLALLGEAGACGLTGCASAVVNEPPRNHASGAPRPVDLPDRPSHNPAFRGMGLPNGEAAVWTCERDGRFRGYRLNRTGTSIFRLCDGKATPSRIAARFARETGRSSEEASRFLAVLEGAGVVVTGGRIVPDADFPRPPPGGCYHTRLDLNAAKGI